MKVTFMVFLTYLISLIEVACFIPYRVAFFTSKIPFIKYSTTPIPYESRPCIIDTLLNIFVVNLLSCLWSFVMYNCLFLLTRNQRVVSVKSSLFCCPR